MRNNNEKKIKWKILGIKGNRLCKYEIKDKKSRHKCIGNMAPRLPEIGVFNIIQRNSTKRLERF